MKKQIIFSVAVYAATCLPPFGGTEGGCQNIAINTDGSPAEANVLLDLKGIKLKADPAATENIFQIKSFDASGSELKLRLLLGVNPTATSRYGAIDVPEFPGPTYRSLALQPLGGNVGIGTTLPAATLEISGVPVATRKCLIQNKTADASNLWGMASSAVSGGARLEIVDADAENTDDKPLIWIERKHDGLFTGPDPSVPVCMYVQHIQEGAGTAFTHSIMGLAVNNGTGDNDVIAVSGRAIKNDFAGGIGDAAGVWGSAYSSSTRNGGVMGMEAHIYQNVAGIAASDALGVKWSSGLHIFSSSTASDATAGIVIDGGGEPFRFWNAILIDGNSFRAGAPAGTVGLNMASANPEYGIKFGSATRHIYATGNMTMEAAGGDLTLYNAGYTSSSNNNAYLVLNADQDNSGAPNTAFIDFKTGGVFRGNIAVNGSTAGTPLELNSASANNVVIATGGGTTQIGANGTGITKIIKTTVNIDPPSLAAGANSTATTFAVANAALTSSVLASPSTTLAAGYGIAYARVSAAGTVLISFFNNSAGLINPAPQDFYITIIE